MKFKNPAVSYKGLIICALYLTGILAGFSTNFVYASGVSASEVISLTNQARSRAGVGEVRNNSILARSAQMKADDMAAKSYFAHANDEGQRVAYWLSVAGYSYKSAGENLAKGYFSSNAVVNAWIASPSHYSNLVNGNYEDIGIGVAEGSYNGNPTLYVVQHFGQPKARPVAVKPVEAAPVKVEEPVKEAPIAPATPKPAPVVSTKTHTAQPVEQPKVEEGIMPQILDFVVPSALAYEDASLRFDILNSGNNAVAFHAFEQEGESAPTKSSTSQTLLAVLVALWLAGSMIEMYIPQIALVWKLFVQKVEFRYLQDAKPVL